MLRGAAGIVAVAAVWAAAAPARAQGASPRKLGVDLGVQAGYGRPFGRINDNLGPVNDAMSSFVPIALDAGYQIEDGIAVGLLLQYGVVRFREQWNGCAPASSCRGWNAILAVHATLHAPVKWRMVPWLRLGAGYEWLGLTLPSALTGAPSDTEHEFRGWMFGIAQLGADYAVLPWLALGPVVGLSVGRYNFASGPGIPEMSLVYKTVHEWLSFGVRGVFHL
jgi:hypothetical protein